MALSVHLDRGLTLSSRLEGWNLLTRLERAASLGRAGFFAIGALCVGRADRQIRGYPVSARGGPRGGGGLGYAVCWFSIPAVRLQGLYLAIATLAFGIGVERAIYHFKGLTGGPYGLTIDATRAFGFSAGTPLELYYLVLVVAVISAAFVFNLARSGQGRMLTAIRDSELAAASSGVNVVRVKMMTFATSAALAALGGVLYGPALGFISVEQFTLWLSITFISMIVVGGLGSIAGSFLGAAFVILRAGVVTRLRRLLPNRLRPRDDTRLRGLADGSRGSVRVDRAAPRDSARRLRRLNSPHQTSREDTDERLPNARARARASCSG